MPSRRQAAAEPEAQTISVTCPLPAAQRQLGPRAHSPSTAGRRRGHGARARACTSVSKDRRGGKNCAAGARGPEHCQLPGDAGSSARRSCHHFLSQRVSLGSGDPSERHDRAQACSGGGVLSGGLEPTSGLRLMERVSPASADLGVQSFNDTGSCTRPRALVRTSRRAAAGAGHGRPAAGSPARLKAVAYKGPGGACGVSPAERRKCTRSSRTRTRTHTDLGSNLASDLRQLTDYHPQVTLTDP